MCHLPCPQPGRTPRHQELVVPHCRMCALRTDLPRRHAQFPCHHQHHLLHSMCAAFSTRRRRRDRSIIDSLRSIELDVGFRWQLRKRSAPFVTISGRLPCMKLPHLRLTLHADHMRRRMDAVGVHDQRRVRQRHSHHRRRPGDRRRRRRLPHQETDG